MGDNENGFYMIDKNKEQFLSGNELVVRAAQRAGARFLFGYPITPTTEIMTYWSKLCQQNKDLHFVQAEDELAAGFMMLGAVLAGQPAFCATAGPGNILMQDALSMAEAMRLPAVTFVMARGGPSTATVIYSQQELVLTTHGGNGEGYRIVLAPSNLQELYDLSIKAFQLAWQYRFPVFVLGDGYLAKMQGPVKLNLTQSSQLRLVGAYSLLGQNKNLALAKKIQPSASLLIADKAIHLRNCFNWETEILAVNQSIKKAFDAMAKKVSQAQIVGSKSAKTVVIAYGSVAMVVKQALATTANKDICLFRPITLSPFSQTKLRALCQQAKHVLVFESSQDQLANLVRQQLSGMAVSVIGHGRPGVVFGTEEIAKLLNC